MDPLADIRCRLFADLDRMSPGRRVHMKHAYDLLPPLERPRILDLGCGRGGPTLELARISGGRVIGIDVDGAALAELDRDADAAGLRDRIATRATSFATLDVPHASFDLLWAEGSIHALGFEEGLASWRDCLRPGGGLVIHESAWLKPDPPPATAAYWSEAFPCIRTLEDYAAAARLRDWDVRGGFALPESFWWEHYFGPLAARLATWRASLGKRGLSSEARALLAAEERRVARYRADQAWFGSVYLVLAKPQTS